MIIGLDYLFYKDRLMQLGFLNLQNRRFWTDLYVFFQYLRKAWEERWETGFLHVLIVVAQGGNF